MVFVVSWSSRRGLASALGTPNGIREGPAARMSTLLGAFPCTMKPAIITRSAAPTWSRVEMFPSVAGLGVGVGVGVAPGVAVGLGVGVAEGTGVVVGVGVGTGGVGEGVGVAGGVGVAVDVGVTVAVGVAVGLGEGVGVGPVVRIVKPVSFAKVA